jgi:hypothetical protein
VGPLVFVLLAAGDTGTGFDAQGRKILGFGAALDLHAGFFGDAGHIGQEGTDRGQETALAVVVGKGPAKALRFQGSQTPPGPGIFIVYADDDPGHHALKPLREKGKVAPVKLKTGLLG